MDLDLLEGHAKKEGRWSVVLDRRQNTLVCRFNRPTNSEGRSWDNYSYFYNGARIGRAKAERIIDRLFAEAIGVPEGEPA